MRYDRLMIGMLLIGATFAQPNESGKEEMFEVMSVSPAVKKTFDGKKCGEYFVLFKDKRLRGESGRIFFGLLDKNRWRPIIVRRSQITFITELSRVGPPLALVVGNEADENGVAQPHWAIWLSPADNESIKGCMSELR